MASTRKFEGLNYRQAQKRNSEKFNALSKTKQKKLRQQGYKNVGWDNVCKSWSILQNNITSKAIDLLEYAVKKAEAKYKRAKQSQDLLEVLNTGSSLIGSLKAKYQ
ncbi:hypothetical protein [Myxosarcina sp. GI1(2024)]